MNDSGPAYVPDLMPLKTLPRLRKLHLDQVDLGKAPCFSELTQLVDLAILRCTEAQQELQEAVCSLLAQKTLHSLQLTHPKWPYSISRRIWRLQNMQSLMLCWQRELPASLPILTNLKVLALVNMPSHRSLPDLSALTALEALSLAGWSGLSNNNVSMANFADMTSLR